MFDFTLSLQPVIQFMTLPPPPGFEELVSTFANEVRNAFCARHSVAPVVEYFPMSKVNDAFERLRSSKAHYRIVLINDFDKSRTMAESRAEEQPEAALTA